VGRAKARRDGAGVARRSDLAEMGRSMLRPYGERRAQDDNALFGAFVGTTPMAGLRASAGLFPEDGDPGAFLGALGDGVTENEFVVAGLEGGKGARVIEIAGVQVLVEITEKLHEGIGIAFGVAAGVGSVTARLWTQERRVFGQFFTGGVAAANPEGVR
jgi:hypothetical protein